MVAYACARHSGQRRDREGGGDVETHKRSRRAKEPPLTVLERAIDDEIARLKALLQSVRDTEAALRVEVEASKPLALPGCVNLDVGGKK